MSAWLLPAHLADVLPSEARRIEELRRSMLDAARGYGYELVMPPLLEHLDSLLSGTGHALDLQTFKLVDQLSGRTLGVRADTTPQVARIDAHLLNRSGLTRLCYCGPVVHTLPDGPHVSREPLQLGAELYGHAGLEADLEVAELALECLHKAGAQQVLLDLADARIVRGILADLPLGFSLGPDDTELIYAALAAKDITRLRQLRLSAGPLPAAVHMGLEALCGLYGGPEVLEQAQQHLPAHPLITQALTDLRWLLAHLHAAHPQLGIQVDLADLRGYQYYSGTRFAIYAPGATSAVVRGGRYDEVGAVFGRNRPAVGFSLDLKQVVTLGVAPALQAAIRAPWGEEASLRQAIRDLRQAGHTVVCALPGHDTQVDEFHCDRELVLSAGKWQVQALSPQLQG